MTNSAPAAASAHSPPADATSTPATGAPTSDASTYEVLSNALARSHRWLGTTIGKRDLAPAALSGAVSEETPHMTRSSGGGSELWADRPARRNSVTAAIA